MPKKIPASELLKVTRYTGQGGKSKNQSGHEAGSGNEIRRRVHDRYVDRVKTSKSRTASVMSNDD